MFILDAKDHNIEIEELCRVLASIDKPEVVRNLLEDLCTIREVQDFAQRLSVAKMLDDGDPYVNITESTGASATTIARVSKALNYGAGGYRYVLDNILKKQESKQ